MILILKYFIKHKKDGASQLELGYMINVQVKNKKNIINSTKYLLMIFLLKNIDCVACPSTGPCPGEL